MREKLRDRPVKVTLYMEECNRQALKELAKGTRESLSQYVENLIESQWEAREIGIEGRKIIRTPFQPKSAAAVSPAKASGMKK